MAMAMLVMEVALIAVLAVMFAGGFVIMALTGPGVGGMAGYNTGLMMIIVAAVATVGAGSLHLNRQHVLDHARQAQELSRAREEIAQLRKERDADSRRFREQLTAVHRDMRAILVVVTARANADADQFADRRRAHRN